MRAGALVFPLALIVAAGCGNDETGPATGELMGKWDASVIEYTSVADAATKVDIASLGATATITLADNGDAEFILTQPGQATMNLYGTWSASSDVLTLDVAGGGFSTRWQFDYTLTGDVLTLTGADAEYDFNSDGQPDAAKLRLVVQRA